MTVSNSVPFLLQHSIWNVFLEPLVQRETEREGERYDSERETRVRPGEREGERRERVGEIRWRARKEKEKDMSEREKERERGSVRDMRKGIERVGEKETEWERHDRERGKRGREYERHDGERGRESRRGMMEREGRETEE